MSLGVTQKTMCGCPQEVFWGRPQDIIRTSFSEWEELDADPKANQQINFAGNLGRDGITTEIFIIEEAKETVLGFRMEL